MECISQTICIGGHVTYVEDQMLFSKMHLWRRLVLHSMEHRNGPEEQEEV